MQVRTAKRRPGGIGRSPFSNPATYDSFAERTSSSTDTAASLLSTMKYRSYTK